MALKTNGPGCCPCAAVGNCGGTPAHFNVTVKGCSGLNLPGATVTAHQAGQTDVVGTTNSSGQVTLAIGNSGVWSVTASKARFNSASQNVTATCNVTTSPTTYNLSVATGYFCTSSCADPLPTTLHVTDPVLLTITALTYGSSMHGWGGCTTTTASLARDNTCANPASRTVPIFYSFDQAAQTLRIETDLCFAGGTFHIHGNTCPGYAENSGDQASQTLIPASCAIPFSASYVVNFAGTYADGLQQVYGSGTRTFTVSE